MAVSRLVGRTLASLAGVTVIASTLLATGCIVEPREGFYDRDHHRWYHEHHWRDCDERDEHCRG